MILGIAFLARQATANLGQPTFGGLTTTVDFGLDIRRVAVAAMPLKDALVLGLDLFAMRFDSRNAVIQDVPMLKTRSS